MKIETIAVHGGYSPEPTTRAVAVPIYQTVSYAFDNTQHGADLFDLKVEGNIYTRIMNPTQDVLEKRVAAMEGGIAALALSSGQAAVNYSILTIAEAGDNVVAASTLLGGCGLFGGVRVETAYVSAQPPSDIQLYVSVEDGDQPIDYLDDGSFEIYENDVLLQSADVGLRLLPRDSKAIGHTVLLLDLSGPEDGAHLAKLRRGAEHLVEKVSVTQGVTVLAFDGAPGTRRVASRS